ncbi:hypothetical protein B0H15DRAFT_951707 [Mycena belliarum]|uniref:Uncharacterized protein n=1 Tax=Mycena belliarum TaxID=1033014 RepID=A0AAD6XPF3_9AGAR|nr:hypothetical protein B0H15DRAFT_951707 [Mycena belliae]
MFITAALRLSLTKKISFSVLQLRSSEQVYLLDSDCNVSYSSGMDVDSESGTKPGTGQDLLSGTGFSSVSAYLEALYAPEEYAQATAVKKSTWRTKRGSTRPKPYDTTQQASMLKKLEGKLKAPPTGVLQSSDVLYTVLDFHLLPDPSLEGNTMVPTGNPIPTAPSSSEGATTPPVPQISQFSVAVSGEKKEANTQPKDVAPAPGRTCAHCGDSWSGRSLRSKILENSIVCSTCKGYESAYQRLRPLSSAPSSSSSAAAHRPLSHSAQAPFPVTSTHHCTVCMRTDPGKNSGWRRSKVLGGRICKTCYNYEYRQERQRQNTALNDCADTQQRKAKFTE